MRVVFMGTPEISATCLKKILADGFQVVGVYTQPDRPKGRGMKLTASPVKQVALEHAIPVFQPESFRQEETVEELRALKPDICAVVAYGRILPQKVLDVPTRGCINIHASVLPRYRGSAPYQWAVLDGQEETGVTAMYLCREMDAGDIIDISRTPIDENETAGQLLDRLAVLGADLLSATLKRFEAGTVPGVPQNEAEVSYAPMLDKQVARLNFSEDAKTLHNLIRGLSPWPVAHTTLDGKLLKVHRAILSSGKGEPGTVIDGKKFIVACGEGALELLEVQLEGGKRMKGEDFLRGRKPKKLGE